MSQIMIGSLDSCLQTTVVILLKNCHRQNRWEDLGVWQCPPEAAGVSLQAGGRLSNGDAQMREEEEASGGSGLSADGTSPQPYRSVQTVSLSLKRTKPKPQFLFSS